MASILSPLHFTSNLSHTPLLFYVLPCPPISTNPAPAWNRTGEPVRGSTALLTGYLVAYTQLIPEHQVQIFGRLKIRVKVSLLFTLACTLIPMVSCELLLGIEIGVNAGADVDLGIWFGNE